MKRLWWLLGTLLGIMVLGVAGVFAYLQLPVFGELPRGERLERMTLSPNYVGGTFLNLVDTPRKATDQSEWSMWMGTLFGKEGQPRPPIPVPAVKTDLKALDPAKDLVVWLGHSSFFVQVGGQRILIDPVFSINAAPIPWTNEAFDGTSIYTAEDMPEIDALLISHDHYDHLDYPSVKALEDKLGLLIVGLGVGAHFDRWGFDMSRVHESEWNDVIALTPEVQVHVTPARHYSGRTLARDQSLWVGFALASQEHRLFFSGDSGYGPHFAQIGDRLGPFDWVALDAGQYDPRWANVHMNPEQAAKAAEELRTDVLMQAHVGRFSIAPHDWDDPFKRMISATRERPYALWTPGIGQPVYLDGRAQSFTAWWKSSAMRKAR